MSVASNTLIDLFTRHKVASNLSMIMMLLSGVWFSLEGTNSFMQGVSKIFPLTQMLDAARPIMLDGAGLADVMNQIIVLSVMTAVFLTAGSLLFRWDSK